MDLHHPILREFPEHRDTIKRLQAYERAGRKPAAAVTAASR